MARPDSPRAIHLDAAERAAGAYGPANIQRALEAMHQDGVAVLKGVVDVSHAEHLRTVMAGETAEILERGVFNQGVKSNILQFPPVHRADCLFEDVWFNPFIVQIANAYLGHRPVNNFYTANNALAGTEGMRQPVHKDIRFHHPRCPFYMIANFALSDLNPENGATEFWLGSHAHTTGREQKMATASDLADSHQKLGDPHCFVRDEYIEQRRAERPPVQPSLSKGDVLLRDLRTWHAGMPNTSDEDRLMLAIGYQAPWFPSNKLRLFLPAEHAEFFMRRRTAPVEVELRANLVESKEELAQNYDFTFTPSAKLPDPYDFGIEVPESGCANAAIGSGDSHA